MEGAGVVHPNRLNHDGQFFPGLRGGKGGDSDLRDRLPGGGKDHGKDEDA